jgi:putative ABC transport system permease protein
VSGEDRPRRSGRLFRDRPAAEVEEELSFHFEERVAEYVRRGMDPEAARAAARERLGDLDPVRTDCTELLAAELRTEARRTWLGDLRQDIAFAFRSAARAPLFAGLAVLTLALGIGANAAIFGVVKSVLLDALPYQSTDRVVRVYAHWADGAFDRFTLSAGTVRDVAPLLACRSGGRHAVATSAAAARQARTLLRRVPERASTICLVTARKQPPGP